LTSDPTDEPEAGQSASKRPGPEAPGKSKRWRLTKRLFVLAAFSLAVILAASVVAAIGTRFYLLTDSGRSRVVDVLQDQRVSRFGRLHVERLDGDLFEDFTLGKITITDENGTWLEARNVRVKWSVQALLARRFHAEAIEADVIRLIRRPEVEPPDGKPPRPPAIGVTIDSFSTRVELMEGFSRQYGRWELTGDAQIPRRGERTAKVDGRSLNRPGDFLKLAASFGGKLEDLRLDLRASEAQGGPLAGAMGYSPGRPFTAIGLLNGKAINVVVRTGEFTPLSVQGHYGKAGARVAGYADFSGSDLFQPFVDRIGRSARFGFAAVPDPEREGYQAIGWRLYADNLQSRAFGLLKISDRSAPEGIKLELSTGSLSRLAGTTLGGAATWTGVFSGDRSDFDLNGQFNLLAASLSSYRAERLSGPLNANYSDRRLSVDSDARAAGGVSEGIVGALLGATPRVQLKLSREPGGAFVLQNIEAQGQALRLSGTGGRSLLGGMSFRGETQITDVSRIRQGATGGFGGSISAASARRGTPWAFKFDGRGSSLLTGLGELDRLLGQTPRLQADGQLARGRLEVTRSELTGAAGRASAKGLIGTDGSLRLALDWNARGPFGVGPVAVEGAMIGAGALTGTLARPRVDLTADFDTVTAGPLVLKESQMVLSFRRGADASDGRIVINSTSNYGPAKVAGNFGLDRQSIRLTEVDLNAGGVIAQGTITLSDRVPSMADMVFSARPGAFIASGSAEGRVRLIDSAGSETAFVDVTARNLRLSRSPWIIRNLDLEGQGTLDRLPMTLAVDVGGPNPIQFNGSAIYSRTGEQHGLSLTGGGRFREVGFTTRGPSQLVVNPNGRTVRVNLTVGGGIFAGELNQDQSGASLNAELTAVELGSIAPDLRGQVTGKVALSGQGSLLTGTANVTMRQVRSVDAPRGLAVDGTIEAYLNDATLRINAQANDGERVRASVDIALPVEASAAPLRLAVARNRNLSGDVSIQGQIQPIWDLLLGGERSLTGQVDGRAALGGTLAEPLVTGALDVTGGTFRDNATGLRLNALNLASRFDGATAQVESFSANDGSGGTVTGNGRIGLREGSPSSFQLALARFRIIDNEIAEARASGPLTVVRGADGNIQLNGRIDVDEARIEANPPGSNGVVRMDVVEINKPGGDLPEDEQRAQRGPQFGLNLQLRSPGGDILVVGRGLNVELNLNAQVTGTISRPALSGNASVVRGDYEFAGKRFVFDPRGTVALSTDPNQIRLDLSAVRDDPALTATIRVTGTAASPKIALTSNPSLPQDEILSQVLFGRSASQLSGFETAQLAAGVAALAGGGGFDVIGNLRELAGLDRLSFGGQASALTVAGGRYITDNVYLEIIGGGEGGAAVNVEWQVRRNLAISSKFGGTGETTLAVRWRRASRPPGSRVAELRQE